MYDRSFLTIFLTSLIFSFHSETYTFVEISQMSIRPGTFFLSLGTLGKYNGMKYIILWSFSSKHNGLLRNWNCLFLNICRLNYHTISWILTLQNALCQCTCVSNYLPLLFWQEKHSLALFSKPWRKLRKKLRKISITEENRDDKFRLY